MTRKPVFDAVKAARGGRAFLPMEVALLDSTLDTLGVPREGEAAKRKIGPKGIALIKRWEGCKLTAYPDPGTGGKPWTIGVGTTVYPDGRHVKPGDKITEVQADEYLRHDVARFEAAVNKLTGGVATQGQFDALVSWFYNVGTNAARHSTLLRKHNEGDYDGAAKEFSRWVNAGGKKLTGLVRRRTAERALYLGDRT